MDIIEITKKVLQKHTPDDSAIIIAKDFILLLQKIISDLNYDAQVVMGGSIAKNTHLKEDHDCDIFVRFSQKYTDIKLSDYLFEILQFKNFSFEKLHGSRDYAQLCYKNMLFEIVPVCQIQKPQEAKNVTDMSYLHVDWVNTKTKNTNLCDEIRLTKVFCKAQQVYGAESYIGGFSGHILDLLVIWYGGFVKLLEASQKWSDKEVINPASQKFGNLNKSKIETSPLIIIDPILPQRNAAASLTKEKCALFQKCANEFLQKPSLNFFVKKPLSIENVQGNIYEIQIKPLSGKIDVVGAKIKKVFEYICTYLRKYDFIVYDAIWEWNKKNDAILLFDIDSQTLPPKRVVVGPPIRLQNQVEIFCQKYSQTYVENNRYFAKIKRNIRTVEDFFSQIKKNKYVQDKTCSIRFISE